MQIIGHCRFSWLGISDTGRELLSLDDPAKTLWDARRMAVRFHLFETLLLPSIMAQTNQNFSLILTVSQAMPQMYHDRLAALTANAPMITLHATEQTDIGLALSPIVNQSIDGGAKAVHFRVDDDDGLSHDFIARLRQIVDANDFVPSTAISFPKGVLGLFDGTKMRHAPCFRTYIAIGLAFVLGPGYRRDPFRVAHRQVGDFYPSYIDPTFCAYHYTRHSANNTSGYSAPVHAVLPEQSYINRQIAKFPDLAAGADVTEGLDSTIDAAFPFTNGAKLRADLSRHAQYDALAEEMGFLARGMV